MKTLISLIAASVFSYGAIAMPTDSADSANEKAVSILETSTSLLAQDEQAPPPAPAVDQAVLEPAVAPEPAVATQEPAVATPEPAYVEPAYVEPQAVVSPQMEMAPSVIMNETSYMPPVASSCCSTCCVNPCCCCPPPPTPTTFCLVDPCGCSHEACIEVPACCAGQEPCVSWRGGIFGRQIATLCWDCCGHEVKVVVARNGKVRVRG